jgi:hypothetical protein
MGESVRAYARRRGVSHVAVLKAIRTGRISREADGTIEPAKADAEWDAQTQPTTRSKTKAGLPKGASTETPAATTSATAEPEAAPAGATFTQARTAHEIAKAQRTRIQVQRMKEEVVDRSRATALVFRLARQERDAWVNWPGRVAALMASELDVEPHAMQRVLEIHVRAHLAELAEVRPEFR